MKFKNKVQEQFKKAGWYSDRNVSSKYLNVNTISDFPETAREFHFEYGDLVIEDCKPYDSEVIDKLHIEEVSAEEIINEAQYEFNKKLFPLGYLHPDHYSVYIDSDEKVYLIGDYYFIIGNSLKEGIENIIEDNWTNSLEWDSIEKKWLKINPN